MDRLSNGERDLGEGEQILRGWRRCRNGRRFLALGLGQFFEMILQFLQLRPLFRQISSNSLISDCIRSFVPLARSEAQWYSDPKLVWSSAIWYCFGRDQLLRFLDGGWQFFRWTSFLGLRCLRGFLGSGLRGGGFLRRFLRQIDIGGRSQGNYIVVRPDSLLFWLCLLRSL